MKISLKDRLLRYLKNQQDFIASGELQRLTMGAGYSAANGTRRLRELENEGLIEVTYRKGHAHYRYKPQYKTVSQIIIKNGQAVELKTTKLM